MLYFSYQFELFLACDSFFFPSIYEIRVYEFGFIVRFLIQFQLLFNYICYWQFTLNIAIIKLFLPLFDFSSLVYAIVQIFLA